MPAFTQSLSADFCQQRELELGAYLKFLGFDGAGAGPQGPREGGSLDLQEAHRHAEDPGLGTTPGLSGHPIS